jgi:hypothetical protein
MRKFYILSGDTKLRQYNDGSISLIDFVGDVISLSVTEVQKLREFLNGVNNLEEIED